MTSRFQVVLAAIAEPERFVRRQLHADRPEAPARWQARAVLHALNLHHLIPADLYLVVARALERERVERPGAVATEVCAAIHAAADPVATALAERGLPRDAGLDALLAEVRRRTLAEVHRNLTRAAAGKSRGSFERAASTVSRMQTAER